MQNSDVVKNACMALASLVSESEESAYAALQENEEGKTGIEVITAAYKQHHDDPDVAENACCFYMEISEIGKRLQCRNNQYRFLFRAIGDPLGPRP